jgi:hypothetical protein
VAWRASSVPVCWKAAACWRAGACWVNEEGGRSYFLFLFFLNADELLKRFSTSVFAYFLLEA